MIQERVYSANEYADAQDRITTLEAEVERLKAELAGCERLAEARLTELKRYRDAYCGALGLRSNTKGKPNDKAEAELEKKP